MSFEEKLGPNYRFSQRDVDGANEAYRRYFLEPDEPWTEEMEFAELALFVEGVHRKTGAWPTLSEAIGMWNHANQRVGVA